tara:strand:- start:417 stop:1481 length:1065 start_codon:yes stop_codon:yes gene_type:complete
MAKLPPPTDRVVDAIDTHHAARPDKPRPHLGASILGHHCDRWVWLSFRWAVREQFPGRIRRLFRRGHNEETILAQDLRAIGIDLRHTGYDQKTVVLGGHLGGSVDGIAESGVPGAEKSRHIVEFKTHAIKSFEDLIKTCVLDSKPMHWCQMQLYMHGLGIDRALYVAVCKNDDRIYTERVRYDKDAAESLLERGRRISTAERIPDPISTDPSWWRCKFCPAHSFCHERRLTQEVNCRTCAHSTPSDDGKWGCARWEADHVEPEHQRTGCHAHVLHPDLVPWQIKDSDNPHEAVYEIDGVDVRNGEADAFTFSSQELIAGGEACASQEVSEVKRVFPGAKVRGVRDATRLPTTGN